MRASLLYFSLLLCCVGVCLASESSNSTVGIELASWKWHHLQMYITMALFIFAIIMMKVVYEYLEIISSVVPESCMLVVIGIIFGAVLRYGLNIDTREDEWALNPDLFLLILLPPIVLDAALGLCQRAFADVLLPVMIFAVVATTLNFLIIGFSLFGLNVGGAMGAASPKMSMSHCLLFGSLIVAVDPVAVLAIFEEIGVDKTLYFLVFGESLFNDAVTIVLYNMMKTFVSMKVVGSVDIVLGVLSFFTVSLGGALVGLVFGILSCLLTRCSTHSKLLQPMILLSVAYLSYLAGDLVGWSGIVSMIACGIMQGAFAFHNLNAKSVSVTKRVIKMVSNLCESMVFLYLGIEVTRGKLKWDTGFILWALVLCLIARFLITFIISAILNKTGTVIKRVSFTEQFIIGYGGLRGAVAFSLATLISDSVFVHSELDKEHFLTATLFIILFTIFPMGITIKPLVKLLKIHLEEDKGLSIIDEINDNVTDHVAAGIEAITGIKGHNMFREWLDNIDTKYIRPFLQNDPDDHSQRIINVYEKVALTLHYANIDHNHSAAKYLDRLADPLKEKFKCECGHNTEGLAVEQQKADPIEVKRKRKYGVYPGIDTMLSMVDNDRPDNRSEQPKMAFAVKRKLTANPNIAPDDYKGLFVSTTQRRRAITDANATLPENYTSEIHNALKSKHMNYLHRSHRSEEFLNPSHKHEPTSAVCTAYRSLEKVKDDSGSQMYMQRDDNEPDVAINMPEIGVRGPRFDVGGGNEDIEMSQM